MILQVLLDMPKTKHRMVLQKDLLKKNCEVFLRYAQASTNRPPTEQLVSSTLVTRLPIWSPVWKRRCQFSFDDDAEKGTEDNA